MMKTLITPEKIDGVVSLIPDEWLVDDFDESAS